MRFGAAPGLGASRPTRTLARRGCGLTRARSRVRPGPQGWLLVAALSLTHAAAAEAAEVRTISRTIGEGYMIRVPGPEQQLLSRRRLVQYVNLGVYDLLKPPIGRLQRPHEQGQLRLVTSMRLRHDFGNILRSGDDYAADLLQSVDGRQIDLLYGYLEGERLGNAIDFRLGRQYEMSGLDFYAFDGAWVRGHTPAHFAVELFGGFAVKGAHPLGFSNFELDGTQDTPADRGYSPTVGAAVASDDLRWLDARLAWRRQWSSPPLNTHISNEDGTQGLYGGIEQDIASLAVALRLLEGRFAPYSSLRYDIGAARLSDLSVGAQVALSTRHTIRALYLRTHPRFDLDSIFNVFAFEPINDGRAVYEVRVSPRWTVAARGQMRIFTNDTTGAYGIEPLAPTRASYGGGAMAQFRVPRFALRLDGYGLGGEGGTRAGGSVDTRTMVAWDRLAIDARVYGNYFDGLVSGDAGGTQRGYAFAFQGGFNAQVWRGIHLSLLAEEMVTTFATHAFRLLTALSFDWTIRASRR